MSRRTPYVPPEFPVLVASKIRARFEHRHLDVTLRARIKATPHYRGTLLKPIHGDDAEAVEWIRMQAVKWGTMVWGKSGFGDQVKWGWSKRLPNLEKVV